ncbi:MAG TPA: hypothetical protein VF746_20000 [Longimicrobium sp.]|jgi:hypothetical protein
MFDRLRERRASERRPPGVIAPSGPADGETLSVDARPADDATGADGFFSRLRPLRPGKFRLQPPLTIIVPRW